MCDPLDHTDGCNTLLLIPNQIKEKRSSIMIYQYLFSSFVHCVCLCVFFCVMW